MVSRSTGSDLSRLRGAGDAVVDHRRQRDGERRVVERRPPGEQLVQRGAEAVDVAAAIDRAHVAARLLGRHVRRRADERARLGDAGLDRRFARQAEVHDDGQPAAVVAALDHDVAPA